jgi:two-component system OmpR family sensor kinase
MAWFTKSIRWRFVLWLAFLLIVVLTGFAVTAFQLHRLSRFGQLDEELKRRVALLSSTLRAPPTPGNRGGPPSRSEGPKGPPPDEPFEGPRKPPADDGFRELRPPSSPGFRRPSETPDFHVTTEVTALFNQTGTNDFYYFVWSRDGSGVVSNSQGYPVNVPQPIQPGKDTSTFFRNRETLREAFHYTERGDCILVGRSIEAELTLTRRFAVWLIGGGLAILALGISGVWWLAGRVLKPVKEISEAATRISAGKLSERINVTATDNELGQLAKTLNSTFARLEAAFVQQKQFTADASHELRTPLAVLIAEAQTTLSRERSAAEYRATVETCLDTAQEMRKLAETLLELSRLDAGQEHLQRTRVDLADLARNCADRIHPLVDARGLKMLSDLGCAETTGDAGRLNQVITNLLTNAIQYNRPQGEIRISTKVEVNVAVLRVLDTGVGISMTDLPHVFERFYRADKSRGRTNGQSGLGLAITKAIVEAHGGTISVSSVVGEGTSFTVQLPLGNPDNKKPDRASHDPV